MIGTYVSSTSFTVAGDKTGTFLVGVRVRCDCGVDGHKYGTVTDRAYSDPNTTVTIDGDGLTSNLAEVVHGYTDPASVAEHASTHATGGRDALTASDIGALASGADVNLADYKIQRPYLQDWAEVVNALGSRNAATTIDLELGNVVTCTVTGAFTFTFSNPPATGAGGFVLILTNGGSAAVTWPTSVDWPGGTAPTLTAAGVDIISCMTLDAGTTWRATFAADVK